MAVIVMAAVSDCLPSVVAASRLDTCPPRGEPLDYSRGSPTLRASTAHTRAARGAADGDFPRAIGRTMPEHDEVLGRWSRTAPFWDQHRETLRELFGPVSEALIEEADVVPGCSVLDVATGSGEPALRLAEVVGPGGTVAGVDPAAGMIEAARRVTAERSHKNLRFEVAGADSLPFPNDRFDAVVCRFGVMFFPSPIDGIREMLRVVKPGKKVAFAVWHHLDSNPFHYSLARLTDRFAPEPPLPPDAPDAFRFAVPGKLRDIVAEAGAIDVAERVFRFSINAPLSVEG